MLIMIMRDYPIVVNIIRAQREGIWAFLSALLRAGDGLSKVASALGVGDAGDALSAPVNGFADEFPGRCPGLMG